MHLTLMPPSNLNGFSGRRRHDGAVRKPKKSAVFGSACRARSRHPHLLSFLLPRMRGGKYDFSSLSLSVLAPRFLITFAHTSDIKNNNSRAGLAESRPWQGRCS